MATGAMHVTVGNFLRRRVAHVANGDIEIQILTRERMVRIDGDLVVLDFDDRQNLIALRAARVELRAHFEVASSLNLSARNLADLRIIVEAVAIFRSDLDLQAYAGGLAFEFFLQTGDELADSVEINQGFAAFGGIDGLLFIVGESVVDADDFAGSDLHNR